MSTPLAIGDVLQGVMACQAADQIALNVYYWRVNLMSVPASGTLEELHGLLDARADADYIAVLPPTASYYGSKLLRIHPTVTQPSFFVDNDAGTLGAGLGGRQDAAIITKKTAVPGRPGRGRVYIPFLPNTAYDSAGHLTLAYRGLLITLASDLVGTVTLAGLATTYTLVPVLVTRAVPTGIDIIGGQIRNKIGNQRRRGDYGRPNAVPW